MNDSPKADIGQRIQGYFAMLTLFHQLQVGFGNIGLHPQRVHVGNRKNGCLGIGGSPQRRDNVSHIGIFGQHNRIERRPNQAVIICDTGAGENCVGCAHRSVRPRCGCNGFPVARLGQIIVCLGNDSLFQ